MNRRWENIFFLFGVVAIVAMAITFDTDWALLKGMMGRIGHIFPLIMVLWVGIYLLNTLSWRSIINNGENDISLGYLFKLTITGFALNYSTPLGLMGGEPYRIMKLSPYIGKKRATSSVLLYVMMHIMSHFCFWITAALLYLLLYFMGVERYSKVGNLWWILLLLILFFILVCWLFLYGFKHGFVRNVFTLLSKIPIVKRWASAFLARNREALEQLDLQIGELHGTRHGVFCFSLLMEYIARMVGVVEYWLILMVLSSDITYVDSLMIVAFSSLFSNIVFFIPMQLGSREGGMAMASNYIFIPSSFGLYTSLVTRVREFIWIVIGVVLMKIEKRRTV